MALKSDNSKHNIVFFGETGTGKSSAINLLLDCGTPAAVSNDSQPCTKASAYYQITLYNTEYILWDTRGLGEGRNFFQALVGQFFGGNSEKELKTFLKERHRRHEIDLLVYCVRGSRATQVSAKYYKTFCAITRRLAAPVAIVVTQLEKEKDMEGWWSRNSRHLKELEMEFDDHACITTLLGHPRRAESREKLVELITRNRRWQPKESGSYFGSRIQKSPLPRGGGISSLFKAMSWASAEGQSRSRCVSGYSASSVPSNSTERSSYHTATADSPTESLPSTPVVDSPTPRGAVTPVYINRDLPGVGDLPQLPNTETSSTESSLHSMFYPSSHSSSTSYSEHLESGTAENEDHLNELPAKLSTAAVKRKKAWASWSGAFGDIWECDLICGKSSRMVAVKALKMSTNDHNDLKSHEKKLHRELKIWQRLRHRNIVPLLGVVPGFGPLPSTVSPWFSNGSLSCYLAGHPISMSKKQRLLGDIAVGLCYLHSQGVIHGDLHSDNVLIDEDGTACLTDFGLSLIGDFLGTSYLKSGICGAMHFADPALVQQAYSRQDTIFYPMKPCDIYSFGGLMLHVLSGKKPYDGVPSTALILTILKGERPQLPTHKHITHWHKSLIRMCWDLEEGRRPSADELVKRFDRQ